MGYPTNMDGLELFTAPFRNTAKAFKEVPASHPETVQPKQAQAKAPQPKTAATRPQQAKPKAQETQPEQPDIPKNPLPEEKGPALQAEPGKAVVPETSQPLEAAKGQPGPLKKELTMDMSDHSIPIETSLDVSEDDKRKAHEKAEAKRKAEWEAKQLAKKQKREAALKAIQAMNDAEAVSESTNRIRADVERLTRRNMKECVAGHIQDLCRKDPEFARQTMNPNKSMIHCFRYINRRAKDYLQQEMKDNDIKPENGIYGGDVPDDLCYQWGIDYFNDPDALEDKGKEETFVPRPYVSTASKPKKAAKAKKTAAGMEPKKKQDPKNGYEQMSLMGVL